MSINCKAYSSRTGYLFKSVKTSTTKYEHLSTNNHTLVVTVGRQLTFIIAELIDLLLAYKRSWSKDYPRTIYPCLSGTKDNLSGFPSGPRYISYVRNIFVIL